MSYGIVCRNWYCGRNECWLLSFALFQAKVKFFDWTKCDLCKLLIDFNGLLAVPHPHLLLCSSQCPMYIGDLIYAVCCMLYASASGMIGNWTACKHCPYIITKKTLRTVETDRTRETLKPHTYKKWWVALRALFHCNVPKRLMFGHNSSEKRRKKRPTKDMNAATYVFQYSFALLTHWNQRFRYDWDSRRREEKNSKQTKRIVGHGLWRKKRNCFETIYGHRLDSVD